MTRGILDGRHVVVVMLASVLGIMLVTAGAAGAQDGGIVVGTVTFVGEPPPPGEPTRNTVNPEVCGEAIRPRSLVVVGLDNGLQHAVVRIVGARGSVSAPADAPTLGQKGCRFSPHVVVIGTGQRLDVLNDDGILHNIHTHSEVNQEMNVGHPGFLQKISLRAFQKPEIFRVGCDIHLWMSAWIVVTDSSFVAVTDENGAFSITGVPPGTYQMTVWHEQLGEQTQEIVVTAGQETTSSFELTAN